VLVAWASKNGDETVTIAGKQEKFDRYPRFITKLPAALVAEIKGNKDKPFPWGRDYSKEEIVTLRLGGTNMENGMKLIHETTYVHNDFTESWRVGDFKITNREGRYFYFRADPTFCGFADNKLEITVVAKNAQPGRQGGMNLLYESIKSYVDAPQGYYNLTDDWKEYTWRVDDASFNGQWGWNFRTDSSGSENEIAVREVRVKKVK
jgi:hypothetical protein